MPNRKTVDKPAIEPAAAAAAEVKKRSTKSTASKPKSTPAATHKRASKKTVVEETAAPVAAPVRVVTHEEIARVAYSYWEARGHQGGDPQDDWFRAERALSELS